ncbi:E3 ubiquitin-protein ligase TRIM39-like isoform X2 [Ambystoma mexicanum]|uniref:E3 ubiquitin-protein ligase TRIM39-like isoform X2 n=1 Tax=Ambystoma mexicanum TaxID=8296 RepID=UPI0037E9BF69
MAAAAQLQSLKEEATCSICLEYFTEPVSVECGHAFCLSCITQCWEGLEANFPCPQCRETSQSKTLRPNWLVANMVEMLKQLHASSNTPQEENLCREHEEKLKLFCEDDQRPICVVCSMSRDHKPHTVLPISEAAQEYKGNIMKQRESILSTFEHLKQFLEKEKQQLLSRLEKEQEEKMKKIQEKLTRLEEQQSTHRGLITDLQRKCQQQEVDLLKDVKSVLRRCSEVKALKPQEDAPGMETTLQSTTRHAHLQEKLTELKETFPAEMDWRYMKSCEREVILDPGTAHPRLIVSADGRSVRCEARAQDLPDTPQRFTLYRCVLGREGLSSGRHYWEVEVGGCQGWALGVCDESVPRKGGLTLSPEGGFWTVEHWDGKCKALTSPRTPLTPRVPPRVLGFFLDYEAGRLSVYDAQDRALLFTFPGASFPRTLRPYFLTWSPEGGLRILPGAGGD